MQRNHFTAPARLRKREVANTWQSVDMTTLHSNETKKNSSASRSATLPHYALGSSADWNAQGSGSWGRVSKRRTSDGSAMSLWEVNEALKSANVRSVAPTQEQEAPTRSLSQESIDAAGLGLLDALVALEVAGQDTYTASSLPLTTPEDTALTEASLPDLDELIAMLHDEDNHSDSTLIPLPDVDGPPGSPSPTSVTELFNDALFRGTYHPPQCDPFDGSLVMDNICNQGENDPFFTPHALTDVTEQEALSVSSEGAFAPQLAPLPCNDSLLAATPVYRSSSNPPSSRIGGERKEWTPAEDALIRDGMLKYGARWRRIAERLPGRSDDAVRNRWNRLKDISDGQPSPSSAQSPSGPPFVARRNTSTSSSEGAGKPERISWTPAEDRTILKSVMELGNKWNKLAERLPGRTDHAIRNRFHRLQMMLADQNRDQADGVTL